MGSLNIDYIAQDNTTQDEFLYADLHLDLENDFKMRGNHTVDETTRVDIKVARDIEAVNNSLATLFSTMPGQRLLYPTYGVDRLWHRL